MLKRIVSLLLVASMLFALCSCSLTEKISAVVDGFKKDKGDASGDGTSTVEPEQNAEITKENVMEYVKTAKACFENIDEETSVLITSTQDYESEKKIIGKIGKAKDGTMISMSAYEAGEENDGNYQSDKYAFEIYTTEEFSYLHMIRQENGEINERWYKADAESLDEADVDDTVDTEVGDEYSQYFNTNNISAKIEEDHCIVTFDSTLTDDFTNEEYHAKCTCYVDCESKNVYRVEIDDASEEALVSIDLDWNYESMSIPEEASTAETITGEQFASNLIGMVFVVALNSADTDSMNIDYSSSGTEDTTGGWTEVEDGTVTEELLEMFNKAFEGFSGTYFEPLELVSTQVVSGTNYKFLCNAYNDDAHEVVDHQSYITIYKDLNGNCEYINDEIIFD